MQIACAQCGRVLEFSGERPSFCAYCGKALPTSETATAVLPLDETQALPLDAFLARDRVETPRQVGDYQLLRLLGSGGMGRVYEAEQAGSQRRVAVKLLSPRFGSSPEAVERFRQEGRIASTISHPRCVFVLAADEEDGCPYIAMELMPGPTLEDLVRSRGPLPIAEALSKILDVMEGLQEAHELGVIHRDVKPSNCFLEPEGRVKIGDFGLSKSLVHDSDLTCTGSFLGTPLYASPEQLRGQRLDARTDVYSVAATLYFLLAGKAPFESRDAAVALARIVTEAPPSLRAIRPEVSPALERLILKGLERNPDRRWRDMQEFRAALLTLLPSQHTVGVVGRRIAAYMLDNLLFWPLFFLVVTLVEATGPWAGLLRYTVVSLIWTVYFVLAEGRWGYTLGKWLMRLRVLHADCIAPPGLAKALVRTVLFVIIWLPAELVQNVAGSTPGFTFWHAAIMPLSLLTLVVFVSTMRSRNGYRGPHELLSGTRVVGLAWTNARRQSPRVIPNRLLDVAPPATDVPTQLGPYAIRGVCGPADSGQLLVGEEAILGRNVLIQFETATSAPLQQRRRDLSRPTRLRWLGHGCGEQGSWEAFLAPAGCPLVDAVRPSSPLSWQEVRALLEPLVAELIAARADGTLPARLSLPQVWVQPNGRVQLLDLPLEVEGTEITEDALPTAGSPGEDRHLLRFVYAVAKLALEGRVPQQADMDQPVHAPLPLHAWRLLAKLAGKQPGIAKLEQLQAELAATRHRPTQVDRKVRVGQVAVCISFAIFGCASLFLVTRSFTPYLIQIVDQFDTEARAAQEVLATPELQDEFFRLLQADPRWQQEIAPLLQRPPAEAPALVEEQLSAVHARLAENREKYQGILRERLATLDWLARQRTRMHPDLIILPLLLEGEASCEISPRGTGPALQVQIHRFSRSGLQHTATVDLEGLTNAVFTRGAGVEYQRIGPHYLGVLGYALAVMGGVGVAIALIVRGGLSLLLTGVTLVRRSGRKAWRLQCAWRALLVWTPILALLYAATYFDILRPQQSLIGMLCELAALGLLLLYPLIALLTPERGLQDRLAGTYLVPR